ncbi:MAG: hypothetical protein R2690_11550 [Acidimicrobiales bacterium]
MGTLKAARTGAVHAPGVAATAASVAAGTSDVPPRKLRVPGWAT